jgi:hypothetical protein
MIGGIAHQRKLLPLITERDGERRSIYNDIILISVSPADDE